MTALISKKGLSGLGALVILIVLSLVVGCSNTITNGDFETILTHTNDSNCVCEECEAETDLNVLKITGSLITTADLEHFYKLLELAQDNDLSTKASIHEMATERLRENTSYNTRSIDNYSLALGFVVDNWYLVESGFRTEETLLLIAGLIFDETWTLEEANDIVNSDHEIIWVCSTNNSGYTIAQPDKTAVCTCGGVGGCTMHTKKSN